VATAQRQPLLLELSCVGSIESQIKVFGRFPFNRPCDFNAQSAALQETFEYFIEVVFRRVMRKQHGK